MSKERNKIIPASYLILQQQDKFLFMQRANTGYMDGFYGLPSGHVEAQETLLQALVREAYEEVGITILPENAELVHVSSRIKCNDGDRIDFFFLVKSWREEVKNCEPEKCAEICWLSAEEVQKMPVIDYLKQIFLKIDKKMLYSDSDLG